MKIQSVVAICIVALAYMLNTWKLVAIATANRETHPYKVFPWDKDGVVSKSNYFWLFVHTVVALVLELLCLKRVVVPLPYNKLCDALLVCAHVAFLGLIVLNCTTFASMTMLQAMGINLTGAGLLFLTMSNRKDFWYLVVLNVPVYLETYALLTTYVF